MCRELCISQVQGTLSSPPHPTLKTRYLVASVKHDVISYVCGSWETSRLARPQSSTFVSSDGHFGIWLCRAVVTFQGFNGEQPCCRHGQVGFAKRQRNMFSSFFLPLHIVALSKCQATNMSKKSSKAPKVRPNKHRPNGIGYRSKKTWHETLEHWTIEWLWWLCRHHWPKHSGVKQESRHYLRTLQQLQALASFGLST